MTSWHMCVAGCSEERSFLGKINAATSFVTALGST